MGVIDEYRITLIVSSSDPLRFSAKTAYARICDVVKIAHYEATKADAEPEMMFLFLDAMHLVHQNELGYCWWGSPGSSGLQNQ